MIKTLTAATLLAAFAAVPALADDLCREQCKDDCALLAPRGSANWAHCAETCIQLSCLDGAAAAMDFKPADTALAFAWGEGESLFTTAAPTTSGCMSQRSSLDSALSRVTEGMN